MILEKIKHETSESHAQLEQSALLQPITNPGLTLAHYQKILRIFYGFFAPLEKKIDRFPILQQYLPDYSTRRKAAMLKEDLEKLTGGIMEENISLCPDLPPVTTTAQAFGSLYVLEGSTLGGRFIAKNLKKHLGLESSNGASFFNGYGQTTGSKWKTFQQALLHYSQDSREEQQIIASANETFHKFEYWIRNN